MRRLLAVCALLVSNSALAGIADPPPVGTIHLYSMLGVAGFTSSKIQTYFACTATSPSAQLVGVQFYDENGNEVGNATTTQRTLGPGQTAIWSTGPSDGPSYVTQFLNLQNFGGTARILSTSSNLICSAFVASTDPSHPIPAYMQELLIVSKAKQKGQ